MIIILLGIAMILLIVLGLHREWLDRYRKSSGGIRNHDQQIWNLMDEWRPDAT